VRLELFAHRVHTTEKVLERAVPVQNAHDHEAPRTRRALAPAALRIRERSRGRTCACLCDTSCAAVSHRARAFATSSSSRARQLWSSSAASRQPRFGARAADKLLASTGDFATCRPSGLPLPVGAAIAGFESGLPASPRVPPAESDFEPRASHKHAHPQSSSADPSSMERSVDSYGRDGLRSA